MEAFPRINHGGLILGSSSDRRPSYLDIASPISFFASNFTLTPVSFKITSTIITSICQIKFERFSSSEYQMLILEDDIQTTGVKEVLLLSLEQSQCQRFV
jgi:hypothetical protein